MKKCKNKSLLIIFVLLNSPHRAMSYNLNEGKTIFIQNCNACHKAGRNVIIPEKNLQRLTLEANGMYSRESIIYQVLNGKNGMPAFGGRLNQTEIEDVADYVLISAENNFEN